MPAVFADLSDRATGQYYCYSQIQLYVDNPLSCLPNYGGVYTPGVVVPTPPPVLPGGGSGTIIVIPPAVQIYAPVFVQQTIVQQFVQVNNIQITNVVTNVNVIQNTTNIINVVNNPPPTVSLLAELSLSCLSLQLPPSGFPSHFG